MSSTQTQMSEFLVDELTSTPVLLKEAIKGKDYIVLRREVEESGKVKIGSLVAFETDDLEEINVAAADAYGVGIVPASAFNRAQLSKDNSYADWTYDLTFAAGTYIDVIFPINNLVVRGVLAASNAINPGSLLQCDDDGIVKLRAAGKPSVARALSIVTSGTGTQVIPMVLFGAQIPVNDT